LILFLVTFGLFVRATSVNMTTWGNLLFVIEDSTLALLAESFYGIGHGTLFVPDLHLARGRIWVGFLKNTNSPGPINILKPQCFGNCPGYFNL
jgi:hypothetical protein